MTVHGKYTLEFEGVVYTVTIDPDELPTTTATPNVIARAVPLLIGTEDKRVYRGWSEFYVDTTGVTGSEIGTLYKVVS